MPDDTLRLDSLLMPLTYLTWALEDSAMRRVLDVLQNAESYGRFAAEHADLVAARPKRQPMRYGSEDGAKQVAVVPLQGTLTPKPSLMSILFGGGGGLEGFRQEFSAAVKDPSVGAVVMEVDSPGGVVSLIPETAAMIRGAKRSGKPIIAHVNQLAASAAYWLASQADEVHITPSGQAGSIGVYMLHENLAERAQQLGVGLEFVKAGKFKTDGNPYQPLSDSAREDWQTKVNTTYDDFVAAVAKGRGASKADVASGYGEGRVLAAKAAVEAGLADRITTLSQTVAGLATGSMKIGQRAEVGEETLLVGGTNEATPSGLFDFGEMRVEGSGEEPEEEPEDDDEDTEDEQDEEATQAASLRLLRAGVMPR